MAHAVPSLTFELYDQLHDELRIDAQACEVRAKLLAWKVDDGWTEVDRLLLYQGRVFVPDASVLWPQLLACAHEGGHQGGRKLSNGGARPSTTRPPRAAFGISSPGVPHVNATRRHTSTRPASSNCYQFQQRYCHTSKFQFWNVNPFPTKIFIFKSLFY